MSGLPTLFQVMDKLAKINKLKEAGFIVAPTARDAKAAKEVQVRG